MSGDQAALDVLAIRHRRAPAFADAIANEQFYEASEGTPTLVEYNLLQALGAKDELPKFMDNQVSRLEAHADFFTMTRNRAYPCGFLVCKLLRDKTGAVSPDFFTKTPTAVLASTYNFDAATLEKRFAELSVKEAREEAKQIISAQTAGMNAARDLYDPKVPRIILPQTHGFSVGQVTLFPDDYWVGAYSYYSADKADTTSVKLHNEHSHGVRLEDAFIQVLPAKCRVQIDGAAIVDLSLTKDITFAKSVRIVADQDFDLTITGGGTLKLGAGQTLTFVPNEASSFHEELARYAARLAKPAGLQDLQREIMPILDEIRPQA